MARPAKSTAVQASHLTNEEKEIRSNIENSLKGGCDKLSPPEHLSENQGDIFTAITTELEGANILCNLDLYVLTTCAIAIARMYEIEDMINNDRELLFDKSLRGFKAQYAQEFFRCCNELCLSPQARAKIGSLGVSANKAKGNADPIADMLNERN